MKKNTDVNSNGVEYYGVNSDYGTRFQSDSDNVLLNPPNRSNEWSGYHDSYLDDEPSVLNQATNISVIVATETVNFVVNDIVQEILVGFMKMIMDFLVKPVLSIVHHGILWPIATVAGVAYRVKNAVLGKAADFIKRLSFPSSIIKGKSRTSVLDACDV